MAVKAVNNMAGLDGIVPTLLVFRAYLRMTDMDPPSLSIIQRAQAIYAATKELWQLYAECQVSDALAMRNGPNTQPTLDLPIDSDVHVWHKKDGWQGPYKLIATNGETCTINMLHSPTNFCLMVVKPYYTEKAPEDEDDQSHNESYDDQSHEKVDQNQDNQSDNDTELTAKNEV
jgi:hypothetical protein